MENSFSNSNQSGKRRVGCAFLLAIALGSCVITELRAQVIVVPNANATNDGNSSLTGDSGVGAVRYMLILDASQFGALSGPSFLTQIAVRPDTIPGPSGPQTGTYRIYASTTSRSVAGMSTTFSQNIGTNNTLVFDGTMTLSTQNLPGPGNTRQFDYVYSPSPRRSSTTLPPGICCWTSKSPAGATQHPDGIRRRRETRRAAASSVLDLPPLPLACS